MRRRAPLYITQARLRRKWFVHRLPSQWAAGERQPARRRRLAPWASPTVAGWSSVSGDGLPS